MWWNYFPKMYPVFIPWNLPYWLYSKLYTAKIKGMQKNCIQPHFYIFGALQDLQTLIRKANLWKVDPGAGQTFRGLNINIFWPQASSAKVILQRLLLSLTLENCYLNFLCMYTCTGSAVNFRPIKSIKFQRLCANWYKKIFSEIFLWMKATMVYKIFSTKPLLLSLID